jgi:hypothetical protein
MADQEYQRLTRARGRGITGFASLWLGRDHLLCINSTGYTEDYKRFYYRDIQAIIIRRTNHRQVWSQILAVLLALFVLFALTIGNTAAAVFFWIIVGILSLVLVLNLAFGPTVRCYLKSAVQTEELAALNRLGRARKALVRLRPLIIAAQGQFSPEEISQRMQSFNADQPAQAEVASNPASPIINP